MGLFLSPFSGNATGSGIGAIDPPPPGDPSINVDTVGRSPMRLLRTTMNKHKPKRMKIVPPGQFRGTLAPPYSWDALERDDWSYETPKRKPLNGLKEGEFDTPSTEVIHRPSPIIPMSGGSSSPKHGDRRGDTRRLPKQPDPRKSRVDAIHQQIKQIKAEIQQLMARKHELVKAGNAQRTINTFEGLIRLRLRIIGEARDYEVDPELSHSRESGRLSPGPKLRDSARFMRSDSKPVARSEPLGLGDEVAHDVKPEPQEVASVATRPSGPRTSSGTFQTSSARRSPQVQAISNQISQKRLKLVALANELKQLHQQMQTSHESVGLNLSLRDNLRRLSVLLK